MSSSPTSYPAQVLRDVHNPSFVSFLDLARWLAAMLVFVGHLRNPLFLGYGDVPAAHRNAVVQAWYFVTGWHAEAVIVFFVLSGYLVGGLASGKLHQGRFSTHDYAIDRVSRLYMAFFPALVLTALLDWSGQSFFADLGFYTHQHPMIAAKVNTEPFATLNTVPLFFANLAMLQTIVVPAFGSNQPLWTISLEFWFYVVFGLGAVAWLMPAGLRRWAGIVAAAVLTLILGSAFYLHFGLWLLGVAIAFVPWRKLEQPLLSLALLVTLLVIIRIKNDYFDHSQVARILKNYLVAASFAWLLLSMRQSAFRPLASTVRFNHFMASFSYSVYLIHFPLMLCVLGLLHKTGFFPGIARGYSPGEGRGILAYILTIAIVVLATWLFSLATEKQTHKVRKYLKSL